MPLLLLLLPLLLWGECALCAELRINSADELIGFSENVSKGVDYSEITVFLDSDIDFSGKTFEPIGNYSNSFLGTFDGQGYTISNLVMNSTSQYVGLFGYSEGTTIKNVVMDSSCFVTSYTDYSSGTTFIGSVIGYCYSGGEQCTILNTVNMANISFLGNSNKMDLNIGGIVGGLNPSKNNEAFLSNCANYGFISHRGTSDDTYIGGIVGKSYGYYQSSITVI